MRLLVISNRMPYPIYDGADLRIYYLTRALAKVHELTFLSQPKIPPSSTGVAHMESLLGEVKLFVKEPVPDAAKSRSLRRSLRELFADPATYFMPDQLYSDVQQAIFDLTSSGRFDGLFVFGFGLRRYVQSLDALPIVFDICDVPSVYYRRLIRHKRGVAGKLAAVKEWLLVRRFEKQELGKLMEILLVSSQDAEEFHARCPRVSVTVIPNGVDADFYRRSSDERPTEPRLIFTGVMDYEPNVTAAVYAATRILPLVREAIPNATLQIVGRNPSAAVRALANAARGVEVTGAVDDIRTSIERAMVYICPLRSGAGIKNKILEAWSLETPIVATSISCEGINASNGEDILIRDDPREFATEVVRLVRHDDLRIRLASAGRKKVLKEYSWDARAAMVDQIYARLLKNQRSSPIDRR